MHGTSELSSQPSHARHPHGQLRRLAHSVVATGHFSRYAAAQSNHTATFSRSTSLSAQGVDKSVEFPAPGVQSLGTAAWRAANDKLCFPRFPVLSHPEPTLCPPVRFGSDLHRNAVVHTFHRSYVDDFLVIPELHKLFLRPVQHPDSPVTHPATVTDGRRLERKYP